MPAESARTNAATQVLPERRDKRAKRIDPSASGLDRKTLRRAVEDVTAEDRQRSITAGEGCE